MPSYDQDKYPPSYIVLVVLQAIRRSSRVNISKSVISFMICFKQKDKEEREVNTSTSLGFLVAINYRLGFSGKKGIGAGVDYNGFHVWGCCAVNMIFVYTLIITAQNGSRYKGLSLYKYSHCISFKLSIFNTSRWCTWLIISWLIHLLISFHILYFFYSFICFTFNKMIAKPNQTLLGEHLMSAFSC